MRRMVLTNEVGDEVFAGPIGASNEGTGSDIEKPHFFTQGTIFIEGLRMDELPDLEVLRRWLQVLAKSEDVDADVT